MSARIHRSLCLLLTLLGFSLLPSLQAAEVIQADLCIYGGTAGGVAAALQAARMGKTAVIAEFGNHLGGLTSGGLGATDIGNKAAIGGIRGSSIIASRCIMRRPMPGASNSARNISQSVAGARRSAN